MPSLYSISQDVSVLITDYFDDLNRDPRIVLTSRASPDGHEIELTVFNEDNVLCSTIIDMRMGANRLDKSVKEFFDYVSTLIPTKE